VYATNNENIFYNMISFPLIFCSEVEFFAVALNFLLAKYVFCIDYFGIKDYGKPMVLQLNNWTSQGKTFFILRDATQNGEKK
jgi:hypothetical protein